MKAILLPNCSEPNSNGHIYPENIMNNICDQLNYMIKKDVAVVCMRDDNKYVDMACNLENITHKIKGVEKNDKGVVIDIELMNTPKADEFKLLNKDDYVFRPAGIGKIKGHQIYDYVIKNIDIIPKKDDGFKEQINYEKQNKNEKHQA